MSNILCFPVTILQFVMTKKKHIVDSALERKKAIKGNKEYWTCINGVPTKVFKSEILDGYQIFETKKDAKAGINEIKHKNL